MPSLVMKTLKPISFLSFAGKSFTRSAEVPLKQIGHDIGRRMSYSINKISKKKFIQPVQSLSAQSVTGKPPTKSQEISYAIKRGFHHFPKKSFVHKMVG